MKLDNGELLYSPSDMIAAARCQFALLRDLDVLLKRAEPLEVAPNELQARAARLGDRHEERILDDFRQRHAGGVVEIARPYPHNRANLAAARDATLAAFAAGVPVVFQAAIFDHRFTGFADFITLTESGDYEVSDAKLARRAKVEALLQIAAYADVLASQDVPIAADGRLLLGDGSHSVHRLAEPILVYRDRRRRFQDLIDRHAAGRTPVAWEDDYVPRCGSCATCSVLIEQTRDVKLVAGLRMSQRAKLRAANIRTIDDLGSAPPEPVPARLAAPTFAKLRAQAALQVAGEATGHVQYELLPEHCLATLPEPSAGDIFFDFEGDPLWQDRATDAWGLEYLFGVVEAVGNTAERTADADEDTVDSAADPATAEPTFRPFWAHDRAEERQALIDFLSYVWERRARYPDMHIYHYASYEKTALLRLVAWHGVGEEELDDLLRNQVLVDLFPVVRRSIRVSQPSYGLKAIESLYMGEEHRESEVTNAGDSVIVYAQYCSQRDLGKPETAAATLQQISDYNRYDCVSTLRLRDWLRSFTGDGVASTGPGTPGAQADSMHTTPAKAAADPSTRTPPGPQPAPVSAEDLAIDALRLTGGDPADRTSDQQALALLTAAHGYHRREEKPYWWGHFERVQTPVADWSETKDAVIVESIEVRDDWAKPAGSPRSNPRRTFEATGVMAPGSSLERDTRCQVVYSEPLPPGLVVKDDELIGFASGEPSMFIDTDDDDGRTQFLVTEMLAKGVTEHGHQPAALVVAEPPPTGPLRDAIAGFVHAAADALPDGVEHAADCLGVTANIFRRQPPGLVGTDQLPEVRDGDYATAITSAVLALDGSTLAVQGPPGTGKTFTAAHVIKRLVEEHGWRVGVVAQSHATTENLLTKLIEIGVEPSVIGKPKLTGTNPTHPWRVLASNAQAGPFLAGGGKILGGTAWTFCGRSMPAAALDLLVVDEAGQYSLANTLAVSVACKRMLLLGDPAQLPQVSKGTHCEPIDQSALGWLSQGHTLRPEFGYFLESTWRMHPAVAEVVSRLAYDGRLRAIERRTSSREMRSPSGALIVPGVRSVAVPHHCNSVASTAEAERVVELIREAMTWQWLDEDDPDDARPMTPRDVLVVAPFNAQVALIRRSLAAAGLGDVDVGTVDKYQGREAPVVVVSMAASEPAEVPRGMEFVLDTNRLRACCELGRVGLRMLLI